MIGRSKPVTRTRGVRLWALLLLLAGLGWACGGDEGPQPASTPRIEPSVTATAAPVETPTAGPEPAPTKTPPAPPAGTRPFPPELQAQGEQILARIAELRSTPAKGPVEMNLVGRQAAVEYIRENESQESLRLTELQQDVYQLVGLIPRGTNIREGFLSLLGIGILGFYDPDQKAFYLVDDLGGLDSATSRTTIVHELAHALQDQYHDINKLEGDRRRANDWDGSRALLQVIEGDAVATEGAYRNASARRAPCFQIPAVINLPRFPYVIQRELNTWYEDGFCFVDALNPSPAGSAALFGNLPTTTEQILHPDKYRQGEGAENVTLAPLDEALGEGWKETARANFGEFTMQNLLVLGLRNDRPKAQRAAAGWGGDGWVLYANDDARLIQVATDWDSRDDAKEFFETLQESLRARSAVELPAQRDDAFAVELEGSTWRVGIDGERVVMLVSTDAAALEKAAGRLGM